jgi:hypothetical protein
MRWITCQNKKDYEDLGRFSLNTRGSSSWELMSRTSGSLKKALTLRFHMVQQEKMYGKESIFVIQLDNE